MTKFSLGLLTTLVLACAPLSMAVADDTGVGQALHSLKRTGKRACFDGHFHSGSGTGSTRKAAEVDAIQSWASFTAFEYGTDWGHWNKAAGKGMTCSVSGSSWSCNVEAMPCK